MCVTRALYMAQYRSTVYKYIIYFRNICTFSSEILKCITADFS